MNQAQEKVQRFVDQLISFCREHQMAIGYIGYDGCLVLGTAEDIDLFARGKKPSATLVDITQIDATGAHGMKWEGRDV